MGNSNTHRRRIEETELSVEWPADNDELDGCSSPSSPQSVLYDHALQSVFAFAELCELHAINAVCKNWKRVVERMPCLGDTVLFGRDALRQFLLHGSTLATLDRHIGGAGFKGRPVYLTLSDVVRLTRRATRISKLYMAMAEQYSGSAEEAAESSGVRLCDDGSARPTLRVLHCYSFDLRQPFGVWMQSFGSMPSLRELSISQQTSFGAVWELPLDGLSRQFADLETLELNISMIELSEEWFSDAQLDAIFKLSALRRIRFGHSLSVPRFHKVLQRASRPLLWEHIGPIEGTVQLSFDDATAHLVTTRLPMLRSLRIANECTVTDFGFLASLRQLTRLEIGFCGLPGRASFSAATTPPVSDALLRATVQGHCSHIVDLSVRMALWSSDQMVQLLNGMPQLTALKLLEPIHLVSLDWIESTTYLATRLRRLELQGLLDMALHECLHIISLQSLQTLRLLYCFNLPLSLEERALFREGFPHLSDFHYVPPDGRLTVGSCNWMQDDDVCRVG